MKTKYIQSECWKCGVALVVPDYDKNDANYCQACAFSKLGVYDYRTEDDSDDK